jgi:hypothetical protein
MTLTIEALKAQRRWVLWKLEKRDGKETKVPYQANGKHADSTDPRTWQTFADIAPVAHQFSGVGIVQGELDGIHVAGVDLDACCDVLTGAFTPEAKQIITDLDSYTEYSPSGTGAHILLIGDLRGRKGIKLPFPGTKATELYDRDRYLTFTGRHISKTPDALMDRADALNSLYNRVAATKQQKGLVVQVTLSEEERLSQLMAGDMSHYKDDHSAADFALCLLLAKKFGCNAFKIDAEFRKSGLYRDKWERDDYRENTITRAITAVIKDAPVRSPEPITDWRDLFHTKDEILNCPPPTFLIDQFLQRQAICAIAAPVGQRKSIIALNVARSLVTKEPLFGVLPVLNQPSRVLYLCPEMGLVSLSERVRNIGVGGYIRDTLFVRSMNRGNLELMDIPDAALEGCVLIVDTAIRFMSGDENSAKDTKGFSDILFHLQRKQGQDGAIVVLYHSPKATKDASELTLENCMRGSGELGAAITDAHGTRLQDPTNGWESESFIRHIKVRDYPGLDDFNVVCERATGILVKSGDAKAVLSVKTGGYKANRDGMDDAAHALIKAHPDLSIRDTVQLLKASGIKREKTWVSDAKFALRGSGSRHTEAA